MNRSQNMIETLAWLREQGFLHTGERALVPFANWASVLDAAHDGVRLYYQAPLDRYASSVVVVSMFKNGGIRLDSGEFTFTADEGHLSRFRMRGVTPSLPQPRASAGVK